MLVPSLWLLAVSPADSHLPPTYDTPWLWVHVATGKVFLGICLVALGLAGVTLLRRAGFARRFRAMPADAALDPLAWRFMGVALVFQSLMLIAGAVWAQDAWGRYWAWDPIEVWAFLTWLALAAALHLRTTFRVPPWLGAAMILGIFVLAFLTFFGVPFLSNSPHKGAI
ncbi:MAG: cytochrome c biogenesis protein CcsA [Candidatus Thermoplasmatota archaeon]|nr:cytochrome c biogenesis protein CcsA [Candidatus Thermoplasmatota archaeon]